MYKKFLLFLSPILLLLEACGAPTAEKVVFECAKQNKAPGQMVTIGDGTYICPTVSDPAPTPDTLESHLNQTAAVLCQTGDLVWFQQETAQWLADHVGGDAYYWSPTDISWVYNPPAGLNTDGQAAGFVYPGFGTVYATEYSQNQVVTITTSNQHVLPQLRFTKLELTCP